MAIRFRCLETPWLVGIAFPGKLGRCTQKKDQVQNVTREFVPVYAFVSSCVLIGSGGYSSAWKGRPKIVFHCSLRLTHCTEYGNLAILRPLYPKILHDAKNHALLRVHRFSNQLPIEHATVTSTSSSTNQSNHFLVESREGRYSHKRMMKNP